MKPTRAELIEALTDAVAHLAGAASAYETYSGNSKRAGRRDALYSTRLADFHKSIERTRTVLRRAKGLNDALRHQTEAEADHPTACRRSPRSRGAP